MARRPANSLARWEVAIVKAMLTKGYVPQDILAYFTRPTRSINHARISEIRDGVRHRATVAATEVQLDAFLELWPDIDPATGLHHSGDELLIKAREAMIAAVQTFNSAGLYFRAVDLSHFSAAPSSHLSGKSFECQGAFPAQS